MAGAGVSTRWLSASTQQVDRRHQLAEVERLVEPVDPLEHPDRSGSAIA